jgi:hypothetical protein
MQQDAKILYYEPKIKIVADIAATRDCGTVSTMRGKLKLSCVDSYAQFSRWRQVIVSGPLMFSEQLFLNGKGM